MFTDRLMHLSLQSFGRKATGLLASTLALCSSALASAPAFATSDIGPKTFYVSKNGDNTDGRTWATAWTDFDQVKWDRFNFEGTHGPDQLVIDGGVKRMVYRKTLKVVASSRYHPVTISVSKEAGHNGQAVIYPRKTENAIEFASTGFIQINGSRRSGLLIHGAKVGIEITGNPVPSPVSIVNVEVENCNSAGIVAPNTYYPIAFEQVIVHDCATNVAVPTPNQGPGGPRFNKCWIYNSSYKVNSDGIVASSGGTGYAAPYSPFHVTNSVLGPGLRNGVSCPSLMQPSLYNCLFINCTSNNIVGRGVRAEKITSFMTRLNPNRMAHAALKLDATPPGYYPPLPPGYVKRSIFYGGLIDVPLEVPNGIPGPGGWPMKPFPLAVELNTQFRTKGNTTLLSPRMVDPKFVTNVGVLPAETPIPLLMRLDFSLKPKSPALGTGSDITSINALLKSFN